jgi:hypothetical protein
MGLISSGIDKVRAFELSHGLGGNNGLAGTPRTALVQWNSNWNDKLYQVYLNGEYAGTTVDCEQRQMVVQLAALEDGVVRVEVFAVNTEEADTDFSSQPGLSANTTGCVVITILREQNLPAGAVMEIYSDGGTGEVDWSEPISEGPIPIWQAWQDKGGFGMSEFGLSDFGHDGAAATGFGKGVFGYGMFGFDAEAVLWVSEPLARGVYRFGVRILDSAGRQVRCGETEEITVIPAAKPASSVEIHSFDKETNQLVLEIGQVT